jgi:hypothetical protein
MLLDRAPARIAYRSSDILIWVLIFRRDVPGEKLVLTVVL